MKCNYSPLRYPGGKAKILDFTKEIIKKNFSNSKKPIYIEPYAGGAAVALGLLIDDFVSEIYINDADPAIYSFWNNVLNNTDRFIRKIINTDITVQEWQKQSAIYKANQYHTVEQKFNLGFATFFLNRCNHSGVLKGGVIGGLKQNGKYKINCRFNKKDLINRILKIASLKEKIHLFSEDSLVLLNNVNIRRLIKGNCLLYLDPPYYIKGHQLYQNSYSKRDHEKIAELMRELEGKWIISYDNVPEIQQIYSWVEETLRLEFNLRYCVRSTSKSGSEIMFFSEKITHIPDVGLISCN